MKKIGVEVDIPSGRIQSGHGEGPCLVLLALAKRALKAKRLTFHRPRFPDEGGELEGEIIGGDEEVEIADEAIESADEDYEAPFADL